MIDQNFPMQPRKHPLPDGKTLLIREADTADAEVVLAYIHAVCGQSDFLTFGPGEFAMTEAQEARFLRGSKQAENCICILGMIDATVVSVLSFTGGNRPRTRHSGEFGLSVLKMFWGMGIGEAMIDALCRWARATQVIKKVNLRVRTDNPRAIALYRRKGFEKEGTLRKEICIGGNYYDHYWMGLAF